MYFVCVISVSAERYDPEADEDDGEKRVSYRYTTASLVTNYG